MIGDHSVLLEVMSNQTMTSPVDVNLNGRQLLLWELFWFCIASFIMYQHPIVVNLPCFSVLHTILQDCINRIVTLESMGM